MKRAVGIEKVGVILALAISPFWFYNLFGVNLGIFDILMIGVLGVYSLRSCEFLIGLTRLSTTAVLLFLLASVVSIFGSPRPVEGLKNVFQYLLIFMVSVPISAIVFREYLTRYFGLLTLWFSLNVLLIWALLGATDVSALRNLQLAYGNQNQLYWLLSSGTVLNIGIAIDSRLSPWLRIVSGILIVPGTFLTILGTTLSAIILLFFSLWLIGLKIALLRTKVMMQIYAASTFLICTIAAMFVLSNLEWVIVQGSLDVRAHQYVTAIEYGVRSFPLGIGLEASEIVLYGILEHQSIHNFFLSYFLEIGIVGATAFTLILFDWIRNVGIPTITDEILHLEFAAVSIFLGAILIMFVQPVPVRRFWWLLFGLTWGIRLTDGTNKPYSLVNNGR